MSDETKSTIIAVGSILGISAIGIYLTKKGIIGSKRLTIEFDDDKVKFNRRPKIENIDKRVTELSINKSNDKMSDIILHLRSILVDENSSEEEKFRSIHNYAVSFLGDKFKVEENEGVYFKWTVSQRGDDSQEKREIYVDSLISLDGIDNNKIMTDNKEEINKIYGNAPVPDNIAGAGVLSGIQNLATQLIATRVISETEGDGSLDGCSVTFIVFFRSRNDISLKPRYVEARADITRTVKPYCVILLEPTGCIDKEKGPCGIYIGQYSICKKKVEVIGNPACDSPDNHVHFGSLIISEATMAPNQDRANHPFLGSGFYSCHYAETIHGSDSNKFCFILERKLTFDESEDKIREELENLKSVKMARELGCKVDITDIDYLDGWLTPKNNRVVMDAFETYCRCVTPKSSVKSASAMSKINRMPYIHHWKYSTNGLGYSVKVAKDLEGQRDWVNLGKSSYIHPPIFSIGAGYEEHIGKAGEHIIKDHLWVPVSVVARFPSLYTRRFRE